MTTQRTGRWTCPHCGSNNFETVTSCWKCNTSSGNGTSPPASLPPTSYRQEERSPLHATPAAMPPLQATYPSLAYTGDPGVAKRAAIALAITLPWIGLPVGWVFMMIEDSRRQAIGRVCAAWSMIALVFHILLMFVSMQAVGGMLSQVLPMLQQMQKGSGDAGGGGGVGR